MRAEQLIVALAACHHGMVSAPPPVANDVIAPPAQQVGLAIAFESNFLWIGNDTWWTGRPTTRTPGYYADLVRAIDALAAAGPTEVPVAIVAYGEDAHVVWQGVLGDVHGRDIGTQQELSRVHGVQNVGLDAAAGVSLADAALERMPVQDRRMLVIGDGESSGDIARVDAALSRDDVEVTALYLPDRLGILPSEVNGYDPIADHVIELDDGDELPDELVAWVTPTR